MDYVPTLIRLASVAVALKIFILGWSSVNRIIKSRRMDRQSREKKKVMVTLGSGGHTTEILKLCEALPLEKYSPFVYVTSSKDNLSIQKAWKMEEKRDNGLLGQHVKFLIVQRIRDVGQSFITALLFRAPLAFKQTVEMVWTENPSLIICNGPGICVPFGITVVITNLLGFTNTKIIYVESICRVNGLSLSGKIMIRLVHSFFVQWEDLERFCKRKYPKARVKCVGRLV